MKEAKKGPKQEAEKKEKTHKTEITAFRLPTLLKKSMEKRLDALGVTTERRSDFYRGAAIVALGQAHDPAWLKSLMEQGDMTVLLLAQKAPLQN